MKYIKNFLFSYSFNSIVVAIDFIIVLVIFTWCLGRIIYLYELGSEFTYYYFITLSYFSLIFLLINILGLLVRTLKQPIYSGEFGQAKVEYLFQKLRFIPAIAIHLEGNKGKEKMKTLGSTSKAHYFQLESINAILGAYEASKTLTSKIEIIYGESYNVRYIPKILRDTDIEVRDIYSITYIVLNILFNKRFEIIYKNKRKSIIKYIKWNKRFIIPIEWFTVENIEKLQYRKQRLEKKLSSN